MTKQTVLIVDDKPANIDILSAALIGNYQIKVATSGKESLHIASKLSSTLDIILLDVMMPDMDGYEVCKALKVDPLTARIPIIFITSRSSHADERSGLMLGAIDYISKPICPSLVLQRVKTHLSLLDQNKALETIVVQRTAELEKSHIELIHCLGKAAEYKDNETGQHVARMSHYSYMLAQSAGLNQHDSKLIFHAAPMHDIGKIGIPDHILLKEGPLNEEEWKIMRTHPEYGAHILGDGNSEILKMAKVIALGHHEKWNGSGYPRGLQGEEIPLAARIVAIADVFDALTSERPYKKAWTNEQAFERIQKDAGSHFDPALAAIFLEQKESILGCKAMYSDERRFSNYRELILA